MARKRPRLRRGHSLDQYSLASMMVKTLTVCLGSGMIPVEGYSMLLFLTFAAATLSLLAFLAVLQLPKAMRNVVQQVHAERTAERQQAVTVECIYRDYLGYSNITSLVRTPMEVGTAKDQTLASIRYVASGTHLDYYYTNIRRALSFAAKAEYALREKRPDEFGGYHEKAVADWHAFLKYARYAGDYHASEQVKRLAGMSADLWKEIGIGLGLGLDEVASRIEADGRSVQSLESVREREEATDWMKRHIGKM
jgi:hypothetical protein